MNDNERLKPVNEFCIDDIVVLSYCPEEIREDGACLALGLMYALYDDNNPYRFHYLALRKKDDQIFQEPLRYRESYKLVLKSVCQDIQKHMSGNLGSVYVEMIDPKTDSPIGLSFWNQEHYEDRSFSVTYTRNEFDEQCLLSFIDRVYHAFLKNYKAIMEKMADI